MGSQVIRKRDWEPRRVGKLYCSPACGLGCTRKEYELAHKRAHTAVKALGHGWKVHVWENLGWHWEVVYLNDLIRVGGPSGTEKDFTVWIQPFKQRLFISADAPVVREALQKAWEEYDELMVKLNKEYEKVRKTTCPKLTKTRHGKSDTQHFLLKTQSIKYATSGGGVILQEREVSTSRLKKPKPFKSGTRT